MVSILNDEISCDISERFLINYYEHDDEHMVRNIETECSYSYITYQFIITSYGNIYYIQESDDGCEIEVIKLNISKNIKLSSSIISNIQKMEFHDEYHIQYDKLFGQDVYFDIEKSLQPFIDIMNK